MRINKKTFVSSVAGVLASSLLAVSVTAGADDTSPGYVEDTRGNIVTSGSGDCVHTGYWKSEMANIVGCDGVTLDAPVEVGLERAGNRSAPDRFEQERQDFFQRVRECYLQIAASEPVMAPAITSEG